MKERQQARLVAGESETMVFETVEYLEEGTLATIRLNRPERLNSFNQKMHGELADVLRRVKSNPDLRCLVLTGAGRAFCSGQDLSTRYDSLQAGDMPELSDTLTRYYNPLVTTLRALPIPVVCVVNGTAAGAGVGLALACDFVVAARSSSFIFSFINVGLVPDAGCSASLVHAVGSARAKGMLMMGEAISALEAAETGMIWKCVDDDGLSREVDVLVAKLLTKPRLALALCKEVLDSASHQSFAAQLAYEARCQGIAGRSPDYRESVLAFVEKRKPSFQ